MLLHANHAMDFRLTFPLSCGSSTILNLRPLEYSNSEIQYEIQYLSGNSAILNSKNFPGKDHFYH